LPTTARRRSILALALLVPVPTIGALAAFVFAKGPVGQGIYLAGKLWIAALPLVWLLVVERGRPSLSPLAPERRRAGLATGLLLGLVLAGIILGAGELFGHRLVDAGRLAQVERDAGLTSPLRYVAFAAYLVVVNSLLEEYVWRWFAFVHCERLVAALPAVVLSGLFFTLHHTVTFAVQFAPLTAALASLGVFAGGCAWSWCYLRFRSIWPGWISHALADVAGLWIGWRLLFA
jgi:membrane protease YdiL (CAAX protease family)